MSVAPIRRRGGPSAAAETAAFWVLRQEAGSLSERDEEAFAAWLAGDLAHVEAYEATIWALDAASHHAGDAEIRDMRDAALAARGNRILPRWLGAVGGAIAASLVALWFLQGQPAMRRPAANVTAGGASEVASLDFNNATYRTRIGERLTVTLPDGSVATLDTDSELRVAYSANERRLNLARGQALFEVAHGRPAPFRVDAAGQEIVAVGTTFNVRIDGRHVRVALLEGHLTVRPIHNANAGAASAQVAMRAGETLDALPAGTVAVRPADVAQMASWRGGDLIFNDTRLADAVAEINRYTRRPIEIEDAAIGALRISGVFRTNDPERFSRAMSEVLPVELSRRSDGALALRARGN
jgi:transmembrane sensor